MARTRGRRSDHQDEIVALAKAVHSEMREYNLRFPNEPFPIDDAMSRILANDADYVPPRRRKGVEVFQRAAAGLPPPDGALRHKRKKSWDAAAPFKKSDRRLRSRQTVDIASAAAR